ncbi:protein phyllopod [Toxorhynchites rutilus septentrionalis]|uniref:protein phyllopod n=1 Tax=Toxorhynchites rutilus septentrionalis TaxID=329112 RepID=UPI002479FE14|nr:protein phyllopod [Toxorhynchites rutilus septentrionalis]
MSASSSSNGGIGEGAGRSAPTGVSQGSVKKTNVCLICGIYTNLSLNIFEPRSGPNIREVIYQKYNFRAEREDNEDKYICYSCNNWLINWYSLQHLSETRNCESTPSSSRSQAENRQKRTKNGRSHSNVSSGTCPDKENLEQDDYVSSTVRTPEKKNSSQKRKPKRSIRNVLKESCDQNMISSCNNCNLVKPFDYRLIRMLENQGTSVVKENMPHTEASKPNRDNPAKRPFFVGKEQKEKTSNSNEIVLCFNSAISEVVTAIPSLKSTHYVDQDQHHEQEHMSELEENFLKTHRLSRSLSISLIDAATIDRNQAQADQ